MWDIGWENSFLFSLNIFNEAECLVCNQKIKEKFACNLKRHYNRHSDMHSLTGIARSNLIIKLKEDLRIKYNQFMNTNHDQIISSTSGQLKATYTISLALAKKGRPFEDGELWKEICISVFPFFGDVGKKMENIVNEMALSRNTIMRRTEKIGLFIQSETNERITNAKFVSVCFDESLDNNDTSQMIICIRTIDDNFNSFEEILKLESFYGNVNGETIYSSFERNVLSLINRNKLSAVCTDGAAVLVGRKQGFVGRLLKAGINIPTFHCIIHQQALFAKSLGFADTMKTAIKIINRLRGGHNALMHRKLVAFLEEVNAEYADVLLFTEVRWLSRGKSLERLFSLRVEIDAFLQSEASPKDTDLLTAIKCPDFLLELAFLTDITRHINNLNLVLQGKDKNICETLYAITEFSRKLVILQNQMASQNLLNFEKVSEIHSKFPNFNKLNLFSEELKKLIETFKLRFKDIFGMQWVVNIYNNPLTCSMENVPLNIQQELVNMRNDLSLPLETGIPFWKNICPKKYGASRDLILNLISMFSTTYICEATFSSLSQIKSKYRNKLSDNHVETLLKIKCYNKEIDIDKLIEFHNLNT